MALAAVAAAAAVQHQPASPQSADATLAPCRLPRLARAAQCGTLTVPEHRTRPRRSIALRVVVVPASEAPGREAVFFLTGGPGTAASASAGPLTTQFAALAGTHDFVFVDQRGTGGSHPLTCDSDPAPLEPMFGRESAARCRAALEPRADLTAYTTGDAAEDLEAVRRALGYRQINLHGSSYGTRLAWTYAARFPQQTGTLVLHGPVPPGFRIPLPFARGLDTALEGVIGDCLADAGCSGRFPNLRADVAAAFDRLRSGPVRVHPTGGTEAALSYGEFAEGVRYLLYAAASARRLPLLLTQAAAGDYGPIAAAAASYRRTLDRDIHSGQYLSVTCTEDIPFLDPESIGDATRGTRLGDYRIRSQTAACSMWPRGLAPAGDPDRPLQIPALILVGTYDPATPLSAAERAAALLPKGRLVVVPHGAHALSGLGVDACIAQLAVTLIREGSASAVDAACVAAARRPPFALH